MLNDHVQKKYNSDPHLTHPYHLVQPYPTYPITKLLMNTCSTCFHANRYDMVQTMLGKSVNLRAGPKILYAIYAHLQMCPKDMPLIDLKKD